MNKKYLYILILLLFIIPSLSFADTEHESQLNADEGSGANSSAYQAQTFKATSSYSLGYVKIKLAKSNSPVSAYLDIYATSSGVPTGSALTTSNTFDASILTSTYTVYTFTFPTPYPLTSGTTYALVLRGSAGLPNNIYWYGDSGSDSYADGQAYLYSSGSWTSHGNDPYDEYFDNWEIPSGGGGGDRGDMSTTSVSTTTIMHFETFQGVTFVLEVGMALYFSILVLKFFL